MYQVPGTDIVFACIMCALMMALAFVVGDILSRSKLKADVDQLNWFQDKFIQQMWDLEDDLTSERTAHDSQLDAMNELWARMLDDQKKDLAKKHRAAMQKYKAKCDAKLVLYIERQYEAQLALNVNERCVSKPDFSLLLSK